ncbi:hypothetical protein K474DRAFT_643356 [Panus rudis PR-1116 ss-1]|nr:hypothetical protein K474DRAFT_643356 [Panus rudis PR-1116 ss-1]
MGTCVVSLIVCCTQPSFALGAFYVNLYLLISLLRLLCDVWAVFMLHKSPLYTTHRDFLSINGISVNSKFCIRFIPLLRKLRHGNMCSVYRHSTEDDISMRLYYIGATSGAERPRN